MQMKGNAIWILTDGNTTVINDVLNERYILYDFTENYYLYRLALNPVVN